MMRSIPSDSESHEREAFDLAAGLQCPPPETLLPAIEGTLPEPLRARTVAHLETCRVCRALAAALESAETADSDDAEAARIRARIDRRLASRRAWWSGLAAAAGIIITVGVAWMFRLPPVTDIPAPPARPAPAPAPKARTFALSLTAPPIELPPGALVLRGDTADPYVTALAGALEPFGRGDYQQAASRLEAVRATRPDDPFASYYLGVSYLLAGRPQEATALLQRARELTGLDTALHSEATWYLAVALERSDRVDQTVPLLKQLCGSGGSRDAPACAALVALVPPRVSWNNRDAAPSLLSLPLTGLVDQRTRRGLGRATG
jgi:tetratricopeptide (TPR) repeat protein